MGVLFLDKILEFYWKWLLRAVVAQFWTIEWMMPARSPKENLDNRSLVTALSEVQKTVQVSRGDGIPADLDDLISEFVGTEEIADL
jgi:hypothetical protein